MSSENRFGVRVLLRSLINGSAQPDEIYEERVLVVQAPDQAVASNKAEKFIAETDRPYKNGEGETVEWLLDEVLDIYPILDDSIADGTEVYSALLDEQQADLRRQERQSEDRTA